MRHMMNPQPGPPGPLVEGPGGVGEWCVRGIQFRKSESDAAGWGDAGGILQMAYPGLEDSSKQE
jgi:hypothetical protein